MLIHEYGTRGKPLIVLLHPMLTDGALVAGYFRPLYGSYRIVSPDLSGQGEDTGTFISAKEEAEDLLRFLRGGPSAGIHIRFLFGASLGTAVAAELLRHHGVYCDMVLLDGAVLSDRRHAQIVSVAASAAFVAARAVGKIFPALVERHIQRNFGPFGSAMMNSFMRTSGRSVRNMLVSCTTTDFPALMAEEQKRLLFVYGNRDGLSSNAGAVKRHYPAAHVHVLKGYRHCEYLAKHPDEYMRRVEEMLERLDRQERGAPV